MNYHRNVLLKLLFIFTFFLSNIAFAFSFTIPQHIIIYRDFGHKGDENQIRGVIFAYAKMGKDLKVEEFNLGQEKEFLSAVQKALENKKEKTVVLAVGEKTVSPFANLLPIEGATTVHLCHMVTANHSALLGKVDFIALPTHSVREFENALADSKTQLIKTVGVSHNRQIKEIERTYHANNNKIPLSNFYLGVILAGDAPTPDNKVQLFTEANARELARYIASILKDQHLLIINGPRTGKYDPQTLTERKEAHRDGKNDFITQAFLDELKKSKISEKQISLFNFQFGVSTPQDMDLLLGTIRATNSTILVPGESTSSISECIDVLPRGSVVVYHNTAMNKVHTAHVETELEAGRIKLLQQGFKETREQKDNSKNQDTASHHSAAETIAAVLSH